MKPFSVLSHSSIQTRGWGKRLGKLLTRGDIVGLTGELGSGKTCFVHGLAEGLEVDEKAWVRSPTFTLINEYDGKLPLYHIDLYRIAGEGDIVELNLREYLYGEGISVIEWFDHLPTGEFDEHLRIGFEHVGRGKRRLTFLAHGPGYETIVEGFRSGKKGCIRKRA
jgi:tRNA threonylcarbamoyladenosine biosynthesis protein TsaE